jgi:hypothetical protein
MWPSSGRTCMLNGQLLLANYAAFTCIEKDIHSQSVCCHIRSSMWQQTDCVWQKDRCELQHKLSVSLSNKVHVVVRSTVIPKCTFLKVLLLLWTPCIMQVTRHFGSCIWPPDCWLARSQRAPGRSCYRPIRPRVSVVFLGPRANAELVANTHVALHAFHAALPTRSTFRNTKSAQNAQLLHTANRPRLNVTFNQRDERELPRNLQNSKLFWLPPAVTVNIVPLTAPPPQPPAVHLHVGAVSWLRRSVAVEARVLLGQSMWVLRWTKWHCDSLLQVLASPISTIPPMLHNDPKDKRAVPGNLSKGVIFLKSESIGEERSFT